MQFKRVILQSIQGKFFTQRSKGRRVQGIQENATGNNAQNDHRKWNDSAFFGKGHKKPTYIFLYIIFDNGKIYDMIISNNPIMGYYEEEEKCSV